MYAPSTVSERLQHAASGLKYLPKPHSLSDVDRRIHQIEAAMEYDPTGKLYLSRPLTPDEHRFIENERVMCACDAEYFLTRYCWLTDETNTAVRFKFRGAQSLFFSVIANIEAERKPIELLIAKGRQQYITTISELLDLCRVVTRHYTNCFVASADRDKTSEMMKKALFAYDHMPWWLKPKASRRVEGVPGLLEFSDLDSRITFVHGSGSARSKGAQRTGIARGTTPTIYHLSEAAHFPNPEEQIEAAIFRSVHASPKVLGVIESSFAGDVGWFPDKYKYARAHYSSGLSRLCALFFPWPCAREIYPTPTWWRANRGHITPNWRPSGRVLEQIAKAELFIRADPLLSRHFGPNWVMPIEQQWYYHVQFIEAERSNTMSKLFQEMPCDDIESMVSSYDNVFGREVIEVCHEAREKQYDVYGFSGQAIDDKFEPPPDEIDYARTRTILNHRTPRGEIYRWEMIPLKYELFEGASGNKNERDAIDARLIVYHHPEEGCSYSIGADSATGTGSDYSVFSVNRVGAPGCPDIQVAEFRSNYVGHVELYAFILPVALMYLNKSLGSLGWPMFAVEQVASVGDVCQNELRKLGYPTGRMHHFGRYDGIQMKQATNKLGWFTGSWSRPLLLGHFTHAVRNGWCQLNSPWTIEECREFEVHYTEGGKMRFEHSRQYWDDGIFAAAISYFIVHDRDSLAERSRKQVRGSMTFDERVQLKDVNLKPVGWTANPSRPPEPSLDRMLSDMRISPQRGR